jgi:hypothetical protein
MLRISNTNSMEEVDAEHMFHGCVTAAFAQDLERYLEGLHSSVVCINHLQLHWAAQ